jgi:hypothetical protein
MSAEASPSGMAMKSWTDTSVSATSLTSAISWYSPSVDWLWRTSTERPAFTLAGTPVNESSPAVASMRP